MRRLLIGAACLVLWMPGAYAQNEAGKRAKVEELFSVMRLDHTMDQLMALVRQESDAMVRASPGLERMTPAQKQAMEELQAKLMNLALETVSWKAVAPDLVKLYADTYSEQEIDGLITFYKSPVGQTMLDKQPELTKATLQITQQRVLAMQPKMQALVREYQKQLGTALPGGVLDSAPPPPPPPPPKPSDPDAKKP